MCYSGNFVAQIVSVRKGVDRPHSLSLQQKNTNQKGGNVMLKKIDRVSCKFILGLLVLGCTFGITTGSDASSYYYSWYPDTLELWPGDSLNVELILANDDTLLQAYGFRSVISPEAPFDTLVFDWTGTAAEAGNLFIRVDPEYCDSLREYGGAALTISCAPGVPVDTLIAIHIDGLINSDATVGLYTFTWNATDITGCDGVDLIATGYDGVIRILGLIEDVGPTEITSPPDTVSVASSHTPEAIVENFGADTLGPIPVYCTIDTNGSQIYMDSTEIAALAGGAVDTVSFANWTAQVGNMSYTVTVWTAYAGDAQTSNDTISTSVYVRQPITGNGFYYSWYPDTLVLSQGDSFHVELMLANDTTTLIGYGFRSMISPAAPFDTLVFDWAGTAAAAGSLLIQVGPEYDDSLREYGGAAAAFECSPGVPVGGFVAVYIHGQINSDATTGFYSFEMTKSDFTDCSGIDIDVVGYDGVIQIQGLVGDVGPTEITSPPDTLFPDSSYTPEAIVENFGPDAVGPIPVICAIDTNGNQIYADTTEIATLAGYDVDTVSFADWIVPTGGVDYTVTVWTAYAGDPRASNDTTSILVHSQTGVWGEFLRRPIPMSYALFQSYPNPMSSKATMFYQVPNASLVTLKIYDATGRVVRTLVEEMKEPGYYTVQWNGKTADGREVASGVYFYKMEAGDFTGLKKMVVVR